MKHFASLPLLALAVSTALACSLPAQAQTLKKPALDALLAQPVSATVPATFAAFAQQAAQAQPSVAAAVQRYAKGEAMAGDELADIARLLGAYTRLTQEAAVLSTLERMVALPTVRDAKVAPHESPAIIDFGKLVETMVRRLWSALSQCGQPDF